MPVEFGPILEHALAPLRRRFVPVHCRGGENAPVVTPRESLGDLGYPLPLGEAPANEALLLARKPLAVAVCLAHISPSFATDTQKKSRPPPPGLGEGRPRGFWAREGRWFAHLGQAAALGAGGPDREETRFQEVWSQAVELLSNAWQDPQSPVETPPPRLFGGFS